MKEFNNGATIMCDMKGCKYLRPVRYTDDVEPYTLWECINPETGYWFGYNGGENPRRMRWRPIMVPRSFLFIVSFTTLIMREIKL